MDTDQLATIQRPPTINHLQIEQPPPPEQTSSSRPLRKIVAVASLAAGIQFGWALQLSLLTPYVQLLGIPHAWASFIWLCGPISGLLVQPIVGHFSDRCTSRFGRRRPFIVAGTASVTLAVFLIGYAADLGHLFGDSMHSKVKTRAVVVFVVGFWILDVANNMLQGPCRALLADLSGDDQKKMRSGNAFFAFFVAVGNVLGYAAGSYRHLYKMFPFTKTKACDLYCANLKSCFFISIFLLLSLTILALSYVREKAWSPYQQPKNNSNNNDEHLITPCFGEIVAALRNLDKPMWVLMLVMALNSLAWFPFLLYDTDWMGREVYGGDSNGKDAEVKLYDKGVRAGALGLMLNSVVMGFASLGTLGRSARSMKRLWGGANFSLAVCLAMTVLITKLAENHREKSGGPAGGLSPPPPGIKASALVLFTVMGIPLAITYSIPFALASMFSNNSGAGQGLSLGVLNLSVVIPQMIVSLVGGPWDALFGGGNLPAFVVAAIAAAVSGIFALTLLPSPSPSPFLSSSKPLAV